ncbi:hypothetical protein CLG96_07750 [Sphingomonas oleivorans]|uniref:Enamine deaminase RidA n=1 Tax=Sphingomonas oleivorans TaxID=1735121 RepID=A0A2T5FYY8_9SPHN|nr:RidA family protein [Sphingomonas oleivorans]PTQ11812.1 hypothetical protein CLG96_07750 [Sphingomonas oleivorans]
MEEIETIRAATVPPPAGHYSHAVAYGGMIFVSGQFGYDADDPEPARAPAAVQTRRCLSSIARILEAAGSDLTRVLKTTIYVSNIELWPEVNLAYAEMFGSHRPARAVVPVDKLHYGFCVEIEAVAAK